MVTTDLPRVRRLAADPASAGQARRFVIEVLDEWHLEDIAELTVLLVSEVVTNALLHAGTTVTVQVQRSPQRVRVEVADGSTQTASRRHYDNAATTGRGLALVEALSDEWGVELRSDGKTVWFDVRVDGAGGFDRAIGAMASSDGSSRTEGSTEGSAAAAGEDKVYLRNVPLKLLVAAAEVGDAILREAALLALSGEAVVGEAPRWHAPSFDITTVFEPARKALEEGHEKLDLTVSLPPDACDAAVRRLAVIEEGERLAEEGALLSLPSLPEVAACRRWYLGEITRQLQGAAPTPWQLPESDDDLTRVAWLEESERAGLLERATGAVIAADSTNHIIFANGEAAELLGWTEEELVGRRLTTIVPPELRESHLAGYTRYQVTRETKIIGATVSVPALHRDGTRVPVELTINIIGRSGAPAFLAELRRV